MAFERAFITILLAVDLDMVPGVCDNPEDFVTLLERDVKRAVPHYNPEVTVLKTVVKKYVWDDKTGTQIQPKLSDDVRKPQVGDITYDLSDGLGEIMSISEDGYYLTVKLDSDGDWLDFDKTELTWVADENRWEYGDLERK